MSKLNYPIGSILFNVANNFINNELADNTKYLLFIKVKLDNGSWVSVHRAVLLTKETSDSYLYFLNWQKSLKLEYFGDESKFKTVAVQYVKYSNSLEISTIDDTSHNTPNHNVPYLFGSKRLFHSSAVNNSQFMNKNYFVNDFSNINILKDAITRFFNEELTINNRYFVILKIQFTDGQWLSFHKGIVLSKTYLDDYLNYVMNELELKYESYSDENEYKIISFNYFTIPKNRWNSFKDDKWIHFVRKPKSIKLRSSPFNKYNLPVDNSYNNWGIILSSANNLNIIDFIGC